MVLAGISLGNRTDLHIYRRGSVTAVRYRDEVLNPIVKPYASAVGPSFVLMDDNARLHRAGIVDDFLESEGIARIEWLAYSPDFNQIENVWDALGRALCRRFPPTATLRDLETALQEKWRVLDSAVVVHLVTSMNTLCTLCMKLSELSRQGKSAQIENCVRRFIIPADNFGATDYVDLIDWQTCYVTSPPGLMTFRG
ncbi:hypothetical protein AVEN_43029-1 [Araneus ventricosus]|uniref:Tc1-like transposase DDE domain-containing protein n=1 Tax=Araneus ventricosus TaxID=182803 RepID=A0A4Y2JGT0_ARAVE|nr:hypothetical protein AVEN_43029-1 [Araneus ventricosus]